MFNLEQSITEWQRQMLSAGIKTPVPLEELESHLREEIDRQVKLGSGEQEAFNFSAQQMGRPGILNREFKKSERASMTKKLIMLSGILVVLVGMALIMPAAHLYKEQGLVRNSVIGFGWGIPIALLGMVITILGFKKRLA